MIVALESAELHGRPVCSDCPPKMQRKRGCKKPGFYMERQSGPVVFQSSMLQGEGDRLMYECPTGHLLRESPWVYDVINMASLMENASPADYARMSRYMQDVCALRNNEMARIDRIKETKRQRTREAQHGRDVRMSRSHGARRG